ncbi:MAG: FHA domain-containing protein [Pyrinomonadaceae bacterium]
MIICNNCRAENWDGAQFCDECGKPLPRRPAARPASQSFKPPVESEPRAAQGGAAPNGSPDAQQQQGAPSPSGDNGSNAVLSFPEASPLAASGARAAQAASGRPPVVAHARFTINRGRAAGKEFPVHEEEAYIGRWDADSGIFPDVDLDADDPEAKVSRRHARVTRRGAQYFIEDLGSTNGTFINRGRRLLPGDRQPLNDGDEIIIGKTFLRFQVLK